MQNRVPLSQIACPLISPSELIAGYDLLLLDAYGVLVHNSGAMPGASEFLQEIAQQHKDFLVVTNDASRLPETCAAKFQGYGLNIPADKVVTSGSLFARYFQDEGLSGARVMVLGSADSVRYVREAGGEVIEPSADAAFDMLALCDEAGYPFLKTMDLVLTNLCRHIDRGECPKLVVPNPDVIYPIDGNAFGFTSGGAALLLEAALEKRYPMQNLKFTRLGKPHSPMYEEVHRRVAPGVSMVMIGDQIDTDIVGARAAGIDAALVDTGIAKWDQLIVDPMLAPTYRLAGLDPGLASRVD